MYDNARDTRAYLEGSCIIYNGTMHYVAGVRGDQPRIRLTLYPVPFDWTGARLPVIAEVDLNDPGLNVFKIKLGYVNTARYGAVYISRKPSRITTQGLCASNLNFRSNSQMLRNDAQRTILAYIVDDLGLNVLCTGAYPTFDEAMDQLERNPQIQSVAFDRDLAVCRHTSFKNLFFLSYKGEDVAFTSNGEFALPSEFKYLNDVCSLKTNRIKRAA